MKTAFNILPVADDRASMHLMIEVGWYGASFAWYRKDPLSIDGILSYNFNDRITSAEVASNLDFIFNKEQIFNDQVSSCTVFYNFRESILVPDKYANSSSDQSQLDIIYGSSVGTVVKNDRIHYDTGIGVSEQIHNVYRIPEAVNDVIMNRFPSAVIVHSTSRQLQHIPGLQCIVYHNSIKVILFERDTLQLVQQFHYKAPEDVAYHLLNVCDKYDINAGETELLLSGMIDAQSNLFHELYKYFLNISFVSVNDEIFLSNDIREFPLHFFKHLTHLAKCVS